MTAHSRRRSSLGTVACALTVGSLALAAEPVGSDVETDPLAAPSQPRLLFERGWTEQRGHVGHGPLRVRSQRPLEALRAGLAPRAPSSLASGRYEMRTAFTWVNLWSQGEGFLIDLEMLESSVAVAYGMTDAVQVELEFSNRSRFGGELDGVGQTVHDWLGIEQNGRDELERDQFNFRIAPDGDIPGVTLEDEDRGSFSRSAQLTVQHQLAQGGTRAPAFTYALTGRFEIASIGGARAGGNRFDLGLSTAVSRRMGKFHVYGVLGVARYARDGFRGFPLERTQASVLTAAEWRVRLRHSLLFHYLLTGGPLADEGLEDYRAFHDPSHEVVIGWRWVRATGSLFELGLIENTANFDNSPDFGIQGGFTRRF